VTRKRLGLTTIGLLIGLGLLVSVAPIPDPLKVPLLAVVIALLAILFFRFHPMGDVWELAERYGINPWLLVLLILLGAALWMAFRVGLLQAAP
jgi:hypothetical protein